MESLQDLHHFAQLRERVLSSQLTATTEALVALKWPTEYEVTHCIESTPNPSYRPLIRAFPQVKLFKVNPRPLRDKPIAPHTVHLPLLSSLLVWLHFSLKFFSIYLFPDISLNSPTSPTPGHAVYQFVPSLIVRTN